MYDVCLQQRHAICESMKKRVGFLDNNRYGGEDRIERNCN